jgi:hypothetical protein
MIEQALLEISEDMARLTAAMKAKGHDRARAEFCIAPNFELCIHLDTEQPGARGERALLVPVAGTNVVLESSYTFPRGKVYAAVFAEAKALVARMKLSDALACEAWFEPIPATTEEGWRVLREAERF